MKLQKARNLLSRLKADALLITSFKNRYYLSGFSGSAGYLLITADRAVLITDGRYTVQAKKEAENFELIDGAETDYSLAMPILKNARSVIFEDDELTVSSWNRLKKTYPDTEFIPGAADINNLRRAKTQDELKKIKAALSIADAAFSHIAKFIKRGMTENEVAAEIEYFMRKNGAAKTSFDTICASGAMSALPHHQASGKPLCEGDFLVMDYGCVFEGYCSDITRTVVIGKASSRHREIYETVLKAQLAAEKNLRAGLAARDADKAARDIIENAGFGKNFSHSLGHGVGIEIHELPNLSPKSPLTLSHGDVVTIEPGIYIEGFGGVRIEDMAYISENGAEILTSSPKELLEL